MAQNSRRTCEGRWWAVTDLNRGPSRCKRDALTAELTAQATSIVTDDGHSVNARSATCSITTHLLRPDDLGA